MGVIARHENVLIAVRGKAKEIPWEWLHSVQPVQYIRDQRTGQESLSLRSNMALIRGLFPLGRNPPAGKRAYALFLFFS
jgi:hypothetical protein